MVNLPTVSDSGNPGPLQPDVSELILSTSDTYVCETYIFDPVSEEASLGRLFAVAETEDRGGIGSELLDLTIQALQREYYRDPSRGILGSFESALHQANLVLHDTAEQGVRDWMGYFHVAVGVLANHTLHISCAGGGTILLIRHSHVTPISADLSHSPITNPLRTFAQVASGTLATRDVLFLGTSHFNNLFRPEELTRLAIDHSASTISTRLQQLYHDKNFNVPLALLTLSVLPQHIAQARQDSDYTLGTPHRVPRSPATTLVPRKPLIINRSWLKTILVFLARMIGESWQRFKTSLWPYIVRGSRTSSRVIARVSVTTGRSVHSLTTRRLRKWRPAPSTAPYTPTGMHTTTRPSFPLQFSPPRLPSLGTVKQLPVNVVRQLRHWAATLPRSSKIFAGITLLLAIVLVISIVLLWSRRTEESAIQRASEILHDARNSKNAAEDALIYDNREQARTLLAQAHTKTDEVTATGLYTEEVAVLRTDLQTLTDRLQKIVRTSTTSTRVVGDFESALDGAVPTHLAYVNDELFTFHPEKNTAVRMSLEGAVEAVTSSTEGIGFFTSLAVQRADKQIVIGTDAPGIALFDAKDNSLQKQTIEFPIGEANIGAIATYGSRLYLYDKLAGNIFSFAKTLRGYSSGAPWITAADFPKDTIISLGIDGNIYTLHSDGAIRKLLKGELAEFTPDPVDPPLAGATKLLKTEDLRHLYVLDAAHKRVVIFDTQGKLVRQLFLDIATNLRDITIDTAEKTLYVLDGTRVLATPLEP